MRLPSDWDAERASGWFEVHHLIHTPCGWRSPQPVDVICDEQRAREIVYGHSCGHCPHCGGALR